MCLKTFPSSWTLCSLAVSYTAVTHGAKQVKHAGVLDVGSMCMTEGVEADVDQLGPERSCGVVVDDGDGGGPEHEEQRIQIVVVVVVVADDVVAAVAADAAAAVIPEHIEGSYNSLGVLTWERYLKDTSVMDLSRGWWMRVGS